MTTTNIDQKEKTPQKLIQKVSPYSIVPARHNQSGTTHRHFWVSGVMLTTQGIEMVDMHIGCSPNCSGTIYLTNKKHAGDAVRGNFGRFDALSCGEPHCPRAAYHRYLQRLHS